jgi:hypothetical protein
MAMAVGISSVGTLEYFQDAFLQACIAVNGFDLQYLIKKGMVRSKQHPEGNDTSVQEEANGDKHEKLKEDTEIAHHEKLAVMEPIKLNWYG